MTKEKNVYLVDEQRKHVSNAVYISDNGVLVFYDDIEEDRKLLYAYNCNNWNSVELVGQKTEEDK